MRVDIVGSILITLVLMLIAYAFNLGFFACILLMIGAFIVMNSWLGIRLFFTNLRRKIFCRSPKTIYKPRGTWDDVNL